jgi:hypothetical protein
MARAEYKPLVRPLREARQACDEHFMQSGILILHPSDLVETMICKQYAISTIERGL